MTAQEGGLPRTCRPCWPCTGPNSGSPSTRHTPLMGKPPWSSPALGGNFRLIERLLGRVAKAAVSINRLDAGT